MKTCVVKRGGHLESGLQGMMKKLRSSFMKLVGKPSTTQNLSPSTG